MRCQSPANDYWTSTIVVDAYLKRSILNEDSLVVRRELGNQTNRVIEQVQDLILNVLTHSGLMDHQYKSDQLHEVRMILHNAVAKQQICRLIP